MRIMVHSTDNIIDLEVNGATVPTRIWEGHTESGIKIHCFITRVAIDKDEPRSKEFEEELKEQSVPSLEIAYPSNPRLIL